MNQRTDEEVVRAASLTPASEVSVEAKQYGRPDLQHIFQCQPGRESECSFFHNWLGGFVKCLLPESDSVHLPHGPHIITARDGETTYCNPKMCKLCTQTASPESFKLPTPIEPQDRFEQMDAEVLAQTCRDALAERDRMRLAFEGYIRDRHHNVEIPDAEVNEIISEWLDIAEDVEDVQ